jgi:hypothetical protein
MQIPTMPSYIEQMLMDRLGRKLLADFGEPLRPSARETPEPPAEGDDEGDAETEGETSTPAR